MALDTTMQDLYNKSVTLSTIEAARDLVVKHLTHLKRRGSGEDNAAEHSIRVAKAIAEANYPGAVVVAALLHDLVEDCPSFTIKHIYTIFGEDVGALVEAVTKDPEKHGNRKKIERAHLSFVESCGPHAVAIKLADNTDNLKGIMQHGDPSRYIRYAKKIQVMGVRILGDSHPLVLQHLSTLRSATLSLQSI